MNVHRLGWILNSTKTLIHIIDKHKPIEAKGHLWRTTLGKRNPWLHWGEQVYHTDIEQGEMASVKVDLARRTND
jgi:hypothetical protein